MVPFNILFQTINDHSRSYIKNVTFERKKCGKIKAEGRPGLQMHDNLGHRENGKKCQSLSNSSVNSCSRKFNIDAKVVIAYDW